MSCILIIVLVLLTLAVLAIPRLAEKLVVKLEFENLLCGFSLGTIGRING
jgi:hypothetical protein